MGGFGSGRRPASDGPETVLDDQRLEHFRLYGLRKFGYALVANSVRDIMCIQKDPHAPEPVVQSADWLNSEAGREWLSVLIPSVSADAVLARVKADPQRVFDAFSRAIMDMDHEASVPRPEQTIVQTVSAAPASTSDVANEPGFIGDEVCDAQRRLDLFFAQVNEEDEDCSPATQSAPSFA